MKKLVRILAVTAVVAASYSAFSTPVANSLEDGTKLASGTAPRPICPYTICGDPGLVSKR